MKSNFLNDAKTMIAIGFPTVIEDYFWDEIDRWHESDKDISIWEFLGMPYEEYGLFVEGKLTINDIVQRHIYD